MDEIKRTETEVVDTEIVIDIEVSDEVSTLDEDKRMALFDEKYLPVFMKVKEMVEMKKELEEKLDEVKEALGIVMDKYEIKSVKNSFIGLTRIAPSTSISFDTAKFKKEDPELYETLFKKYNKKSNRKAYTKIEV